jgi:hypothetical protein
MLTLKGRPIRRAVPMQITSKRNLVVLPVGRMPTAPQLRIRTAGMDTLKRLIADLLNAVSYTALKAAAFEIPASCSSLISEKTLIPLSTSAFLMNAVLQKLAVPPAKADTAVFISRSFFPDAVAASGAVALRIPTLTIIAEETAARYPPPISAFVYLHVLFLFPKFKPAL